LAYTHIVFVTRYILCANKKNCVCYIFFNIRINFDPLSFLNDKEKIEHI